MQQFCEGVLYALAFDLLRARARVLRRFRSIFGAFVCKGVLRGTSLPMRVRFACLVAFGVLLNLGFVCKGVPFPQFSPPPPPFPSNSPPQTLKQYLLNLKPPGPFPFFPHNFPVCAQSKPKVTLLYRRVAFAPKVN